MADTFLSGSDLLLPQSELTKAGAQAEAFTAKNPPIVPPATTSVDKLRGGSAWKEGVGWVDAATGLTPSQLRDVAETNMAGFKGSNINTAALPNLQMREMIERTQKTTPGTKAFMAEKAATANELIGQLGQITPEQQMMIDQATLPDGTLDWNILSENLKRSENPLEGIKALATSAGSLNAGGAVGGLFDITPLGSLIKKGNIIRSSIFQMYDHQREERAGIIESNVARAKANLKAAIITQNKGGDSITEFNEAYVELLLAEAQYKRIEKEDPRAWTQDIMEKQVDLRGYLDAVYPDKVQRMMVAIQKPDPAYVDYDIQTNSGE